ncbi:unannotated protein [freshwater metagenome]|uniref:Unannotated protein n=1 Tax=freshwater metagenome TaxID=449393 RepID=A0A6J7AV00_9ZZZZ
MRRSRLSFATSRRSDPPSVAICLSFASTGSVRVLNSDKGDTTTLPEESRNCVA